MTSPTDFQHLVIVDLEATCDDSGAVPRDEMEIIEIGAVCVVTHSVATAGEFQAFVRPSRHPKLTSFCTELTSIGQADVDEADEFSPVALGLAEWLQQFADSAWCSWGDYDRKQLERDCKHHGVANPMPTTHFNFKQRFSDRLGTKKRFGMAQALRRVGIPLTGTHHRGIDDARNIAKLAPHCL